MMPLRTTQLSEDDYADLHAAIRQYVSCAVDNGDLPEEPDDDACADFAMDFCADYRVAYAELGDLVERIINEEATKYEARRNV